MGERANKTQFMTVDVKCEEQRAAVCFLQRFMEENVAISDTGVETDSGKSRSTDSGCLLQ